MKVIFEKSVFIQGKIEKTSLEETEVLTKNIGILLI